MSSSDEYVDYDEILLKQAIEIEEREAFASEVLRNLEENSRKRQHLDSFYPSIDEETRNKVKENKELIEKDLETQGVSFDRDVNHRVENKNRVNYRVRPGRVLI
ncbi:hypothetical protein [Vibrio aquimaris]|uniref:Uncharacterized protein n=1 Tax=Vibrio aquimaris TaxID=2587862 RepID=A0A5P9CNA1_9VIBR|nr:hypothetical protein [Vibrio aquimaris]QFT27725.1 hypothetical protein FIV01_15160 [Vibrio aquimaris]